MMTVRLLRLTARCPTCGERPALRTFPEAAALFEGQAPDTVILTYQCQTRNCSTRYEIRARDFVDAA
jgi:hypothetical protein